MRLIVRRLVLLVLILLLLLLLLLLLVHSLQFLQNLLRSPQSIPNLRRPLRRLGKIILLVIGILRRLDIITVVLGIVRLALLLWVGSGSRSRT